MEVIGGLYVLFVFLAIAVAIAWIVLPFAIIGTKPILRDIRAALEENNKLLRQLHETQRTPAPTSRPLASMGDTPLIRDRG